MHNKVGRWSTEQEGTKKICDAGNQFPRLNITLIAKEMNMISVTNSCVPPQKKKRKQPWSEFQCSQAHWSHYLQRISLISTANP